MEKYNDIQEIKDYPKIALGRSEDLRGKKFFKLTPLYRTNTGDQLSKRKAKWLCKCDCQENNYVVVLADNLKRGNTLSCGCEQLKRTSIARTIDITNQRFGKLTVLYQSKNQDISGRLKWHCKCDCGNEIDVLSDNLRKGNTQSCGCLKQSRGEQRIEELLIENNILFKKEKTFNDCTFPKTNTKPRFDFYVNNSYIIEFDGLQHFQITSGWNTKEEFLKRQERDAFKNQYCKTNNVPLIRIPYTQLKILKIEDLILETTKYRVV